MRLAKNEFGERYFAAPERIDVQSSAKFFAGEERLGPERFFAVGYHTFYRSMQREPLDGDAANLGTAAGDGIDSANCNSPQQRIYGSASKKDAQRVQTERNGRLQEPR